jgi:hypothetical protein
MRVRKRMYKPITINRFSMVELMLAVFIVAIGMMGISALMPAGLNQQKSSMSTSFSVDAAEQFLRYNASKMKEDWSWNYAFANEKPGSDEPSGYGNLGNSIDLSQYIETSSNGSEKIYMCHQGANGPETLLVGIPSNSYDGHLEHGDSPGTCEDIYNGQLALEFEWQDTNLVEMGNVRIIPQLGFDPSSDNNSGFFLLQQMSGSTVDFTAAIRAWKDMTFGEDGAEIAELNVEVSWPAAVPYDSPERKKEVYSMVMTNAPEISLESAMYNNSDCSITKTHGGGFTSSLASVFDNGDGTYTIQMDVAYDGCTDPGCNQLTEYIVESDPTYTVDLITGDGTASATSPPATSGTDSLDGFKVEFSDGIGGDGTAGSFTVLYTVLSLQSQSFSAKTGGMDQMITFSLEEFQWVLSCTVSDPTSLALDDGYTVEPSSGSGALSVSSDYGTLSVSAPGVLANDTTSDESSLTAVLVGNGTTKGTLTLNADGSFTYVPGTQFKGRDGFTYKAFSGGQLTNVARVKIEADLEFDIVDGEVTPNMDFNAEFKVLGAEISHGYPQHVTCQLNFGSTTVDPFGDFTHAVDANVNDSNNPRTYTDFDISSGTGVSVTARSWLKNSVALENDNSGWFEQRTRNSTGELPYVHVLRNGDDFPSVPGYNRQGSIVDFLDGYISSDDKVILDDNQVIYLFELGVTDVNSVAFDLQDFVAVITLTKASSGN